MRSGEAHEDRVPVPHQRQGRTACIPSASALGIHSTHGTGTLPTCALAASRASGLISREEGVRAAGRDVPYASWRKVSAADPRTFRRDERC